VSADGDRHRLRVIFAIDGARQPQVRSVILPAVGPSTTCHFTMQTPASGAIRGRLIVQFRNRVLQTALLTGTVGSSDSKRGSVIKLVTETVVRGTFAALSARTPFDLAIVHNHGSAGSPTGTVMHDGYVARIAPAGIAKNVETITKLLKDVAENPAPYAKLTKPATIKLLVGLARHGIGLRRLVVPEKDPDGLGDPERTPRVQVVTTDDNAVFPIEFFYDFPSPTAVPMDEIALCPNAAQALRDGRCAPANHEPRARDGSVGVVCPAGFWSMNRVIERYSSSGRFIPDLKGADVGVATDVVGNRRRLGKISSAMFAWSNRVRPPDAARVTKALATATAGKSQTVTAWDDWVTNIEEAHPDLLVLLAHTEIDEFNLSLLEIAEHDGRGTDALGSAYVRVPGRATRKAPGPIVFLLGCDTARPLSEYQSFVGVFGRSGASIVVGTVATVAARHAANVARKLITELADRGAPRHAPKPSITPFGDLLLTTRRQLLADGEVMALTLTSYGDSDWALG
jgi:hypothetical protein